MLKGFPGNLSEMLEKAQEIQQQVTKFQAELEKQEVEASSGGGMVVAKASGAQVITSLKIDPSVISADDVQMLEDLVRAAVNEALRKSREMAKGELSKITGGLPIPGL